jgi:uncharacterized damage-inducible protein DinB
VTITAFPLLVAHTHWALDRVLDALERADPEALDADPPAPGMAPARATLHHAYGFERFWLPQLIPGLEVPGPSSDLGELRAGWEPVRERLQAYLQEADDDVLGTRVEVSAGGETYRPRVSDILSQLVQHHAQHRAELAVIATAHGQSPGELDWWDFLEDHADPEYRADG